MRRIVLLNAALIGFFCFHYASATSVGAKSKAGAFLGEQQQDQLGVQVAAEAQQAVEMQAEAAAEAATKSLGQVIELLQQMIKDLDTQAQEDKGLWEEYQKWSGDTEQEKASFIQEQESHVMSTEARLNANKNKVLRLTGEIDQLGKDIEKEEKSLQELIAMRKEEHQQFEAGLADLTKTIRAVTHATEILEGHYSASGEVLTQIRERVQLALTMYGVPKSGTEENVVALASFLQGSQSNPEFLNADTSKYENYEHQGGAKGVIGMLTDLKAQLESQSQAIVTNENNSQREYEGAKATKEADLARLKEEHSTKGAEKTQAQSQIEQDIVTIDQAKTEIEDANQYLTELRADRERLQKEFGERHATRNDEMAATQAALDALQAVSIGAKSTVGANFLQVSARRASTRTGHVLTRLVSLGQQMRAPMLIQEATRLQYEEVDQGSFGPVIKLLGDLIARLEEEQVAETTQNDWCETEKDSSTNQKDERETTIHNLKASIEQLTTVIAGFKSEVEFMQSEVDRVKKEMEAAAEQRKGEHELFVQAKADHDEVIAAIRQALEALGGQFGAASFLQVSLRQQMRQKSFMRLRAGMHQRIRQPAPGGALFNDQAGGGAGASSAMEMLQDLLQRYEKALQELIQVESDQQATYEELTKTNTQFISDSENTINGKIAERRGKLNKLSDAKKEMKTNLVELHEIGKYLMDLRPSCDDIRSTHGDRKKRREAEIAALKEALQVMSDPSMTA